jgi:hypothetical protein
MAQASSDVHWRPWVDRKMPNHSLFGQALVINTEPNPKRIIGKRKENQEII